MNRLSPSFRAAICMGAAFFIFQTVQTVLLNRAFLKEDQVFANRLQAGAANLLNEAHRAKDDTAIGRILEALEQIPGVAHAVLLDPDAQPYGYPLKDGDHLWGRMMLVVSSHVSHVLARQVWVYGSAVSGLIWLLLFLYFQKLEKRSVHDRAQLSEMTAMFEAEKRKLHSLEEHGQAAARQHAICLQKAVRCITDPLIILDAQQRIAALNDAASARLGSMDALGKSWHEVALLNSCGPALERSMASPGHVVEWPVQESGIKIKFETDPAGMSGTWVSLSVE